MPVTQKVLYRTFNQSSEILEGLVSSMGRCNAILDQGGRCHETKNSHLLHARTKGDYLGQIQAR